MLDTVSLLVYSVDASLSSLSAAGLTASVKAELIEAAARCPSTIDFKRNLRVWYKPVG